MKSFAKRSIGWSLRRVRRIIVRNKHLKSGAQKVRDVLLPGYGIVNIYDHSRYAPSIAEYLSQLEEQKNFKKQPLISIVMPTYNTPLNYLEECIESVLVQSYPNWELCIADDASSDKRVVELIHKYTKKDKRIKLVARKKNGHISEATNSAIDIAEGDFIALLDHDDILWPNALFEIVKTINNREDVDFIYSDEDKIDETGQIHSYPFFKPDWSPEFLESCNYITHFSCIRTELVRTVGGFRKGYEGAQDWDLFLRISEKTNRIIHIRKLLYSWRMHEASTAADTGAKPYVYEAQRKLLNDHVKRVGLKGQVKKAIITQHSRVEYSPEGQPLVSVVVSGGTKNQVEKNLRSLSRNTSYPNVEFIVSDPNGNQAKRILGKRSKIICMPNDPGCSQAKMCNVAAQSASGAFLIFIDGSTTVNSASWLELMLGDLDRGGVGAVGGRTLNKSKETFMRAGVGLGIYGSYASLLEGMPVEDVHYMRGLYGQSRRNIAAVDSGCFGISRKNFEAIGGFAENLGEMFIVDACLQLLRMDLRNIYNPVIESVDLRNRTAGAIDADRDEDALDLFKEKWASYINDDPYLNPAFSRTNAQLDIK